MTAIVSGSIHKNVTDFMADLTLVVQVPQCVASVCRLKQPSEHCVFGEGHRQPQKVWIAVYASGCNDFGHFDRLNLLLGGRAAQNFWTAGSLLRRGTNALYMPSRGVRGVAVEVGYRTDLLSRRD